MSEKFRLRVGPSAESDLKVIWDYIAQNNPGNASQFIRELNEKMHSLTVFPQRNPLIQECGILGIDEYRHYLFKDYRIVYRIQGETAHVLRIFHGSMLLDRYSLL